MINIRFHVVSLVAVFLALGVGVALGASFIDRATVTSMQDRVDDLETGFRDRGGRLEDFGEFLRTSDEAAEALTGPGSRAIEGALAEVPVVLIAPTGRPESSLALLGDVLSNSGATVAGSIELQSGLGDNVLASRQLAQALAALSAGGGEPAGGGDSAGEGDPAGGDDSAGGGDPGDDTATPVPDPTQNLASAAAVTTLESLSEEGLIAIDAAGQPAESAFPSTTGVRYVILLASGTEPSATEWLVPFVEDYGERSAATMLVAGVAEPRAPGDLPAEADGDEADAPIPLPQLLDPIRTGAASNEVSSVQYASEPLARLAVVYAMQALTGEIVGHFGLGEGVDIPYPAVALE